MFVYALTEPIDLFDGLISLPPWVADDDRGERTAWALRAVLALADVATDVRWDGDMRHLPSIGALPVPPEAELYLVIKQDNNGTTFVISDSPIGWLLEYCDHHTEVTGRRIDAGEHTTRSDLPPRAANGELPIPPYRPGAPSPF